MKLNVKWMGNLTATKNRPLHQRCKNPAIANTHAKAAKAAGALRPMTKPLVSLARTAVLARDEPFIVIWALLTAYSHFSLVF